MYVKVLILLLLSKIFNATCIAHEHQFVTELGCIEMHIHVYKQRKQQRERERERERER